MKHLIIITRKSPLAIAQAEWTAKKILTKNPNIKIKLKKISTKGDKFLKVPLNEIGSKGLFVEEIEELLINKKAHLAVHSMKDIPFKIPKELIIAGISKREDAHDVLISKDNKKLSELNQGAKIGTSSLRRKCQLLAYRSDLKIMSIRGNIETRIKKIKEQGLDGIILASAGLSRLNLNKQITEKIPMKIMLPAVGQGALGYECRKDDFKTIQLLKKINDPLSSIAITTERLFLSHLKGGCQIPIAGHAKIIENNTIFTGLVGDLDGENIIKKQYISNQKESLHLGYKTAKILISQGADKIISKVMEQY